MSEAQESGPVRLDKWLWAARAFKTRSQAAEAIEGGHVKINEEATKPAKLIKPGDRIEIRREGWVQIWEVKSTSDVRGPAAVAQKLYLDLSPPKPERLPPVALREAGAGRPTKKERRTLERFWAGD